MTANRARMAEEVGVAVVRDVTDQVELPFGAAALWVLSDPLDDDCGRTVESSLVVHAIGDRGLSRGGSFVRRLPVQDVGELRSRVVEKLAVSNFGRQSMFDRRLFGIDGSGGDDPDKQGEISESVVEKDVGTGDLRTCWIDTDETGSRSRLWRGVVLESTRETFLL